MFFRHKNKLLILAAVIKAAFALNIETFDHCINPGDVALTFDNGPDLDYTNAILDILDREDVKATFFVNGREIDLKNNPEAKKIIKEQFEKGHIIGSNAFLNPFGISQLTDEDFKQDISELNEIINEIINAKPAFFRSPNGEYDESNLKILEECGMTANVLWNLDSEDWDSDSDAFEKYSNILGNLDPSSVSFITLNHDNAALNQLEKIISYVKSIGYQFVTLDKCIGQIPYQSSNDDVDMEDHSIDELVFPKTEEITTTNNIEKPSSAAVVQHNVRTLIEPTTSSTSTEEPTSPSTSTEEPTTTSTTTEETTITSTSTEEPTSTTTEESTSPSESEDSDYDSTVIIETDTTIFLTEETSSSTTSTEEITTTSTSTEEITTTSTSTEEPSSTSTEEPSSTTTSTEEVTTTTTSTEEVTSTSTSTEETTTTSTSTEEPSSTSTTTEEPSSTTTSTEEITTTSTSTEDITITTTSTEDITSTSISTEETTITSTSTEEPSSTSTSTEEITTTSTNTEETTTTSTITEESSTTTSTITSTPTSEVESDNDSNDESSDDEDVVKPQEIETESSSDDEEDADKQQYTHVNENGSGNNGNNNNNEKGKISNDINLDDNMDNSGFNKINPFASSFFIIILSILFYLF